MINTYWYMVTVTSLLVMVSIWATIANTPHQKPIDRVRYMANLFIQFAISAGAYWILTFILVLVIAAAFWLFLLLLIWVPSDFFQNYFDSNLLSRALNNIKPIIYRSANSPGITAIPLLDYLSLYSAFILGPWFGIWSILSQQQEQNSTSPAQP